MFKDEPLVLDKWFALQAGAPDRGGNVLPMVKQLMKHPDFNIRNPNRARSLIFSYCSANPARLPPPRCRRLCVLGRPRDRDRRDQSAGRVRGWRAPWTAGASSPSRYAAPRARRSPASRQEPDLSNDVREVVERALAVA